MSSIITFYSFKGGVGRSMAVANIGVLLAQRGLKILLVDWDLEAPGLHRYFSGLHIEPSRRGGMLDLLLSAELNEDDSNEFVPWDEFVSTVHLPDGNFFSFIESGLTSLSADYASRLINLNWDCFFRECGGGNFLEQLRSKWRKYYDVTMIDSRTGLTDSGGVCTIQMPDVLFCVIQPNEQNLEGVIDVLNKVQEGRQRLAYDRMPVLIVPLPSRFDSRAEFEEAQEWLDRIERDFYSFYSDWVPSFVDVRLVLEQTKIPYIPYFSFGEKLCVLSHGTSDPETMGYYYSKVSDLIEADFREIERIFGVGGAIFPTDRENVILQRIKRAAAAWERHRRNETWLLRGAFLETALDIMNENAGLGQVDREFLRQSAHTTFSPDSHRAAKARDKPPEIPRSYLDWLWRSFAGIDLLGTSTRQGRAITLNAVYVPAVTPARRPGTEPSGRGTGAEENREPDLLLAQLNERSLFVSAPPGAGKSTFCRWAALQCHPDAPAAHPVPPPNGFKEPEPSELRRRLPLLVPLRELAKTMDAGRGQRTWSRAGLEAALAAWVDATGHDGLTGDLLRAHLAHGSAFVMLDGLDELPTSEMRDGVTVYPRARLLAGLEDALPAWEQVGNRTLVTSRPHGLDEAGLARLGLDRACLDAMPKPLQELFVRRWFDKLDKPDPVEPLLAAMRERAEFAPLIENPLLLTAVCVLYDNGGRLPEDRYELYRSIVGLVLHSRYPGDARQREPMLRRLEAVAHAMHTGAPGGDARKSPAAEVGWMEVERALADFANVNPTYAEGAVDAAVQREELLHRSGLLVPRANERAAFCHLSFQEFLAAQRIARTSDDVAAVFRSHAPVAEWRPTLLFLLAAQIQNRDPEWAMNLLTRLLAEQEPLTRRAKPAPMAFVAEALDLCLAKGYRVPEPLADRFRELALPAIENEIDLQARQSLGLALGRVGDPRVADLRDPEAYIEVPAGTYPVGDEGRTVEITAPFRLGRYPVTNAQYCAFVDGGGYGERHWWSEPGWSWRESEGITEPAYWHDRRWNAPNQPVVGVSYWEAEACAAWAGGRLPTADESEAAARGTAGRTYPWGETWRDGICNTSEAALNVTSPVGLFPSSRHPDGFEDLAGNVWEWCSDLKGDPADASPPRVVRGGSWYFVRDNARCAFRDNYLPYFRLNYLGFRVVCSSPMSSADR